LPVEVSVNCTDWPGAGSDGLNVKDAVSDEAPTAMVRLALEEPELFVTVSVTVRDPAVANAWLGFWAALVPPSPKSHAHDVGPPVDVSVNCTACPSPGEAGLKVKAAFRE
jgi:hypothetical protein